VSAAASVIRAQRPSMHGWDGLHAGMVPCYRDKKRHASWRWGRKKGLRRARRRLDREIVVFSLHENDMGQGPAAAC